MISKLVAAALFLQTTTTFATYMGLTEFPGMVAVEIPEKTTLTSHKKCAQVLASKIQDAKKLGYFDGSSGPIEVWMDSMLSAAPKGRENFGLTSYAKFLGLNLGSHQARLQGNWEKYEILREELGDDDDTYLAKHISNWLPPSALKIVSHPNPIRRSLVIDKTGRMRGFEFDAFADLMLFFEAQDGAEIYQTYALDSLILPTFYIDRLVDWDRIAPRILNALVTLTDLGALKNLRFVKYPGEVLIPLLTANQDLQKSIEHLGITATNFSSSQHPELVEVLSKFVHLKSLDLHRYTAHTSDEAFFKLLDVLPPALERLTLPKLSDTFVAMLRRFPHLTELSIDHHRLSVEGISALGEAHGNLVSLNLIHWSNGTAESLGDEKLIALFKALPKLRFLSARVDSLDFLFESLKAGALPDLREIYLLADSLPMEPEFLKERPKLRISWAPNPPEFP